MEGTEKWPRLITRALSLRLGLGSNLGTSDALNLTSYIGVFFAGDITDRTNMDFEIWRCANKWPLAISSHTIPRENALDIIGNVRVDALDLHGSLLC
jgi:hypothetical protein